MIRLFIALQLPETVRQHLATLQGGVPGARWVPPENLHLTLRFIGEIDGGQAADLDAALGRVAAPGFTLELEGLGVFGPPKRPTSLWAGVAPNPALMHLRDKVDRATVAAGLPPDDRKFTPHVTLARLKQAPRERVGRWLGDHGLSRPPPFVVTAFHLIESHLGAQQALYQTLASYPLTPEEPSP